MEKNDKCDYCGNVATLAIEDKWCCKLHKFAREVYEKGEYVVDLDNGNILKLLSTRKRKEYRLRYPNAHLCSKNHLIALRTSTKKYWDNRTEKEKLDWALRSHEKWKAMQPEVRKALRFKKIENAQKQWKSMTEEEREILCETFSIAQKKNWKEKSDEEKDLFREKVRKENFRRVRSGTHQFLRNAHGAKNFYYERLFDDVFLDFIPDTIRTTTTTLRVFDGWDSDDLSELYREKFAFECDFFNDELNVDFEIDEEQHADDIDYDYDRDAHFLKDRATLTFRYRLFDILSREQEVREDMRYVISELRKGNRSVKSKFEYTKEECRKKWDEYFQMKILMKEDTR